MTRRLFFTLAALVPFVRLPLFAADNEIDGEATVNGKPMTRETRVRPGDMVETRPGSEARFKVGKDVFLLREKSRFQVEKAAVKTYKLLAGAVLAVYDKETAQLQTRTVVAGIRGTGMYVRIEDEKTTYICTCYGHIDYSYQDEEGKEVRSVKTTHHEEPLRFIEEAPGRVRVEKAKVVDHTDKELIELEEMADRVPPFTTDPDYIMKKMMGVEGY